VSKEIQRVKDELVKKNMEISTSTQELQSTKILLNTNNSRLRICVESTPIHLKKKEVGPNFDFSPINYDDIEDENRKNALTAFKRNPLLPDIQNLYLSSVAVFLYLMVPGDERSVVNSFIYDSHASGDAETIWDSWKKHFDFNNGYDETLVNGLVLNLLQSESLSRDVYMNKVSTFAKLLHYIIKIESLIANTLLEESVAKTLEYPNLDTQVKSSYNFESQQIIIVNFFN
jgi:hypothetical protein